MRASGKTAAVILVLGFVLGFAPGLIYHAYSAVAHEKERECEKEYPFTSHSLDCEELRDSAESLTALDSLLQKNVAEYVDGGRATRISVWTRDLESRQWAGVNEFQTFAPASLMKLPIAIAYYKFAQVDPSILRQTLTYEFVQEGDEIQHFAPHSSLIVGQSYTVERMIEEMLTKSDNNAAELLARRIDANFFNTVLVELGIRIPRDTKDFNFITTKTYANIYRSLYNASYLNREYSEKILSLLSQSPFKGITGPLPPSMPVAHKFGEREVAGDGQRATRELHDCGIVYKSPRPYSICIMTEGKDFDELLKVIQDISKIVYDNI